MLNPTPASAAPDAAAMPVVPIISTMQHWDNHWYIWLPQDDVYEAVEVMSRAGGPGGEPLVWAFFTERAGGKRQIHYVNDPAYVSALSAGRPGWHHAPIRYVATGRDGEPRGLDVRFDDREGRPVHISASVTGSGPLTPGRLTDQSGHSVESVMLMFYRGENSWLTDWAVTIGGQAVSQRGSAYVAPFQPVYSRDISVALFPFGRRQASFSTSATPDTMHFARSEDGRRYVAPSSRGTIRSLELDEAGNLMGSADADGANALRVTFDRPLPSPCGQETAMESGFSISISGRERLLTGSVVSTPSRDGRVLDWRFDAPAWATSRHLRTAVSADCGMGTQSILLIPAGGRSQGPAIAQ